ncbi:ABC transporter permease [Sulfoacidibacillus thermotolerans]|uniref:Iron export ABC transporter permease subunit FetB n=1 Tax=Sulfoacidibacillus thermotolerans TaxID=1765684 RepID=A0A2U3D701_SULT2|nr:iron export ABC transporter permease subunit FetB [Sulfoacidibacillus thermotolerans]PWI57041.1 iron export ABC transporter permease subunit FetB [Sulfoacidibacillus thermotolerans]
MSLLTLSFTLAFVGIAILLSMWLKLGVERDIVIATIRSSIQLLAVGYVLKIVFGLNNPLFMILMIALMIGVATQNAAKRGKGIPRVSFKILFAIAITEIIAQSFLIGLNIIPAKAQYLIPISGMIIGNAMIVSGLLLNRLQAEAHSHRQEIITVLALGGTPKQSIVPFVKQAIRASLIPTIDSAKTTGLVQLPGMMTGQIIAGADPILAVRYQLVVLFTFMASAMIASITLGFLTYPSLFNRYHQLVLPNSHN